jgi:hypothetical protein
MRNDGVDFQLSYGYNGDVISLVVNGFIGYADYDKRNPIYGKTQEDDRYGAGLRVFYHKPFGWQAPFFKKTSLYFNTGYLESRQQYRLLRHGDILGRGRTLFPVLKAFVLVLT